ncbi:minor tail protein [Streptomyces phage Wofford]|uniref:Minor tail protein n=1 Tax=Streptomyces phage Wofford TaxID=2283267 RepID=A0A345M9T6_9CAUD|nr:minor tail protein [Streptomyces phage Wollford]AXH67257.1 minor tail protein [Streptomyces phage Wollford]
MQTTTFYVNKQLKEGLAVTAKPLLIAEWNQNRYAGIEKVSDSLTSWDDGEPEYYPLDSIVEPLRPSKKGIVKARASVEGIVSEYSDRPGGKRFYLADVEDTYKYWTSHKPSYLSSGLIKFPGPVRPYVIYKNACWTNKIHMLFETSAAWPVDFDIDITLDGTNWTTVSGDIIPDADGKVVIYRQSNGTWSTTVNRDNPIKIKGVRLNVNTISVVGKYLELIEISARLELDLTSTLISSDYSFNMSDTSFLTPLGNASSNTASIELSNIDRRYDNDNASSMFYGLIDKNVKMTYSIGIDESPVGGSGFTYIRQFTMFTDSWSGQGQETCNVSLKDASKFMQEIKPQKMFFENMTLGKIVWQLCDVIGFTDYNYDKLDDDKATVVPYFWTDGEKTIWEIFSNLAVTTQSAIYFDEFGILQVLTRDRAYNLGNPVVWQLDGLKVGTKQPDIIEVNQTYDFEANDVTVRYNKTSISDMVGRVPKMDIVWQPEGDVVLRSSQLRESMDSTQEFIRMTGSEAASWPYSGIIECEGELIRYDAKGYWYYNKSGVATFKAIKSSDEKKQIDEELSSPELKFKNYFSGWMRVSERGLWNTYPTSHKNDASGYAIKVANYRGVYKTWTGGFVHNKDQSTISLKATKETNPNTCYVVSRGSSNDRNIWYVGTRVRFRDSGYSKGEAGVAFNLGDKDAGYYLELTRTDRLPGGRKYQHEVSFFVRRSNGKIERFGPDKGKGVAMAISKNVWYDIDICIRMENGVYGEPGAYVGHVIEVSINGLTKMTFTIPREKKLTMNSRFGVFTKGNTHADFEYLYGNGTTENLRLDTSNMFDRIRGGIVATQADREWVYATRWVSRIIKKKKQKVLDKYAQRFFDDFGPICHEMREFDVTFEKFPSVHSNIYFSNTTQVACPEYSSDPFGSKFILANTYRSNAVLNGEDTLTFGVDNPVTQQLMIYGRTVNKEDEKTIVVKNDEAIRRRGSVETEVQSEWIQTEAAAKALGDWIVKHWANGCDEIEVTTFGNPLLQVGDIVSVNYPQKGMNPVTHRYFIVGIRRGFNGGFDDTELTLRRVKA